MNHRGQYDDVKGLQLVLTALLGQVYAALSKVICCSYIGRVLNRTSAGSEVAFGNSSKILEFVP